jgi:hypothetical protein
MVGSSCERVRHARAGVVQLGPPSRERKEHAVAGHASWCLVIHIFSPNQMIPEAETPLQNIIESTSLIVRF